MPHDFADLIADLEAAKAGLARSVKRTRDRVGEHRPSPQTGTTPEPDKAVFNWADREKR